MIDSCYGDDFSGQTVLAIKGGTRVLFQLFKKRRLYFEFEQIKLSCQKIERLFNIHWKCIKRIKSSCVKHSLSHLTFDLSVGGFHGGKGSKWRRQLARRRGSLREEQRRCRGWYCLGHRELQALHFDEVCSAVSNFPCETRPVDWPAFLHEAAFVAVPTPPDVQ